MWGVGTSSNTQATLQREWGNSFSFEKADTSVMNFIPTLGIHFQIANSCTRWRGIFKGHISIFETLTVQIRKKNGSK
jgi:hypothetical protein